MTVRKAVGKGRTPGKRDVSQDGRSRGCSKEQRKSQGATGSATGEAEGTEFPEAVSESSPLSKVADRGPRS